MPRSAASPNPQIELRQKLSAATPGALTNSYTVDCCVQVVDIPGKVNAGIRVTLSDGRSLQNKAPCSRHGLDTLKAKFVSKFRPPPLPKNVVQDVFGLKGNLAQDNPTNGYSWAWVALYYGQTDAAAKAAMDHGAAVAHT